MPKVTVIERAKEVLRMISQNEQERELHLARVKGRRDHATAVAIARDEGIAAMIQAFQRLLKQSPTPMEELLSLPSQQLQEKARQLETLLGLH